MSSETNCLIVSHVDRTGPKNSADLNPCDSFFGGFLKEKIFLKKTTNNNGIESTNHLGLQ
jgi:hypothetical protein